LKWQHWLSFQRVVRKLVACNTVIFALSTITTTRDARERGKQREFSRQMQTQKSENKQQLFFEAHSLLFCASFVLSQSERYIRPIKSRLFVIFQKFEILLLFASNKFEEEEDFKKRTKDFAFQTCARARCFVAGVEKRVGGRDTTSSRSLAAFARWAFLFL
jgi:hypothetical protein